MPVIKSAKKRMRQNAKRKERRQPYKAEMKTYFKKVLNLVKEGKEKEAAELLPKTYSVIDQACKRNILHKNTAARRKSRLARAVNGLAAEK